MTERPETKYAVAADGVHIAYQAFGVGRYDIVFVPGQISHLDLQWELPENARWLRQLAQLGRVVIMDRRGVGLSDRLSPADLPPAEVLAEDLGVVMDAAGATRPLLFGYAEGGQISSLFAALHPERISALIVYATWTHVSDEDKKEWEHYIDWATSRWGATEVAVFDVRDMVPSWADDPSMVDWVGRVQRSALSPGAISPLLRLSISLDVRSVLPTIGVPTLVMHRERDSSVDVETLADVAALIPDAQHVVLPGSDHWIYAEPQEPMFEAIGPFIDGLTGVHRQPARRLATVLFTDIVGSTERSAELGDTAWKETLQAHREIVRESLARWGGREISTAGDGFFATFDGPAAACRCALDIMSDLGATGLQIRAGVHTGEVETIDGEIGGLGVTIGARIGALPNASELFVSSTVKDLTAGSGLIFDDVGEHALKGVPDRWRLYRVVR
ncbi:MAG TPA: alpha/beta fold hydrolase [Actinomycetes bacterium]|nr:alpha/beta fold hydrolase [Actinomycetes bacterium]